MQRGLTLIEVILVSALIIILIGITTVNLSRARETTVLRQAMYTLIIYLRRQQIAAMISEVQGPGGPDSRGIYFGKDSYTLFNGSRYEPSNPGNTVIYLPRNIQFVKEGKNLVYQSLIFTRGSGEVKNFSQDSNSLTIENSVTAQRLKMILNRYGVVSAVIP